MRIEVEGLEELEERLNEIEDKVKFLSGKNEIPLDKLFNSAFMKKYTIFNSIGGFFEESEWEMDSEKDIEEIPEEEIDDYVAKKTKFKSWEHMMSVAVEEYFEREIW